MTTKKRLIQFVVSIDVEATTATFNNFDVEITTLKPTDDQKRKEPTTSTASTATSGNSCYTNMLARDIHYITIFRILSDEEKIGFLSVKSVKLWTN